MRLKSTQRKSLATVPTSYQGQERRFAQSVSESLDVLTGRRGDIIDRAVTFRDLIDTGVLKLVKGLGTGGGSTILNPNDNPDGGPTQLPTQPENFTATGGFGIIFLEWDLPPYNGHDYVEIYRLQRTSGAAEPTLVQAQEAGVYTRYYGDIYQFADTNVGSQEQWYYWIRAVNIDGIAGPFYSTDGVDATTALDYLFISGLIDDILDDDLNNLGLNQSLGDLSDDILSLENFTGYTSGYNGDSLVTRIGDVETVAGNAATSAQLQSEQTARANADSALAADITTLNATVYDTTTGVAATYSGLQSEITARANADSALSSSITSLTTTVNGNTASIQTNTSSINGVEAKYSVKVDNNGHVSGFGLISTANNGTVTSSFIVAADRFAIARPFNSSNTNVSTDYPFKVISNNFTYAADGTPIPQGVYIKDAFIHNSQITNAKIGDATITSAKIFDLSATKISSGTITIDNSNSIAIRQGKTAFSTAGNGFWLGNNNNNGSFIVGNGSSSYLKFDGATGIVETRGLTIKAVDGTTLVSAGGSTNSSGNNLVYNGALNIGEYTLNTSTGNWTQSTVATNEWVQYDGFGYTSLFRPNNTNPYILCRGKVRSTAQRFPVAAGEKLYVYCLTGNTQNGQWMALTFYGNQDGDDISGSSTTIERMHSDGSLHGELQVVSGVNRRFWVAEIEVPNYSYANFGELRIGSNTSADVYFFNVGVSRVPPVIDPSYASTYIRDLSVDTLQIAGEAVLAPRFNSGAVTTTFSSTESTITSLTFTTGDIGTDANVVVIGIGNCTSSNTTASSCRLRVYQSGSSTALAETGMTWRGDGISGTVVGRFTQPPNTSRTVYLKASADNLSGGSSTKSGTVKGQLIVMTAKK